MMGNEAGPSRTGAGVNNGGLTRKAPSLLNSDDVSRGLFASPHSGHY